MKTEFQVKFLLHLAKKQEDKGFTLIELLVVIIIIGILSAIALPSFLNQANKAKQSEAKQYVGSMNRAQQAYYLEKSAFTNAMADLGLGIKTQTDNYVYGVELQGATAAHNKGASLKATLKSYVGGVSVGYTSGTSEATTLAVLCESNTVAAYTAPNGVSNVNIASGTNEPECPANYSSLAGK